MDGEREELNRSGMKTRGRTKRVHVEKDKRVGRI